MRLKQPIESRVLQAIEDSFDRNRIAVILRRQMGVRIDNIVADGQPWPNQVDAIYQEFHLQNTVEKLLAVLRNARPAVPDFALALDELGFAQIQGEGQTGRPALEALLARKQTPFQDVVEFRSQLSVLEAQVCKITAARAGTGSLIGPDLVLTNRHVVADFLAGDGHSLTGTVTCIFDHKKGGGGFTTEARKVAVTRVEASSRHAVEDTQPGPMNDSLEFLDYAMLRLGQPVGDQPITSGGDPRLTMDLTPPEEDPVVNNGLVILQHPGGEPMKIDIGSVLVRGPTRIRHSVNTKPGSSGAPVFDAALRLVGIHHSGHANGPAPADPGYNQAIPFSLILADARNKGVRI